MSISAFLLVTIALVCLIDFIPRLFTHPKRAISLPKGDVRKDIPFLVLPTVYGHPDYVAKFSQSFLKQYAHNTIILTTKYESEEFYDALKQLSRETGVRFIKLDMLRNDGLQMVVNAYTVYKCFFTRYQQYLTNDELACILIDADTYSEQNIYALVEAFTNSKADMASLRCEIANPTTLIEKLQAFEYALAMDNRRMDRWLTSGACNMAKAGVYQRVFGTHSEFFAGGDIEIGKIAQVAGYRVRHIDFTFLTLAPDTFKDWFNQRIIWTAGGIRHHVINLGTYGWHHLFMTFYASLLLYALYPLRWVELINYPLTLPLLIALSWIYVLLFIARRNWHPRLLLLPAYSFIQSMIIVPLGLKRYVKYARRQRSLGIIKFPRLSPATRTGNASIAFLNWTTFLMIVVLAVAATIFRVAYWLQH